MICTTCWNRNKSLMIKLISMWWLHVHGVHAYLLPLLFFVESQGLHRHVVEAHLGHRDWLRSAIVFSIYTFTMMDYCVRDVRTLVIRGADTRSEYTLWIDWSVNGCIRWQNFQPQCIRLRDARGLHYRLHWLSNLGRPCIGLDTYAFNFLYLRHFKFRAPAAHVNKWTWQK